MKIFLFWPVLISYAISMQLDRGKKKLWWASEIDGNEGLSSSSQKKLSRPSKYWSWYWNWCGSQPFFYSLGALLQLPTPNEYHQWYWFCVHSCRTLNSTQVCVYLQKVISVQTDVPMDSVAVITYRHGALHYDTLLVSRKFTVFSHQNFNCAEVQRSLPSNGICAARKSKDFVDHETKRTVVLMCKHHYTIKLDAYVAGCVKRMLTHSRQFCKGFLVYVQQKNVTEGILCSELTKMKRTPRMITVQLLPTNKEWIDYKW